MNVANFIVNSFAGGYLPIANGIVDYNNVVTPVCLGIQTEIWSLQTEPPIPFLQAGISTTPENMSAVTVLNTVRHNNYIFYCGEGSFGGDGFVLAACCNKLHWLFFHEYANPIETLTMKNNTLHCKNNLNIAFAIPIDKPYEITLAQPKQM